MKYFKINIKKFYENDMIATDATGKNVKDGRKYFDKMKEGEEIINAPIFDYFQLQSFDKKENWEWMLADVHNFIGEGSQIPGWFISKKLKILLKDNYIANPHFFYPSKLFYQGNSLDYYIFQFSGKKNVEKIRSKINFEKSIFYDPNNQKEIIVKDTSDFVKEKKRIRLESREIKNNFQIEIKKIVLKEKTDFFPMFNFLKDNIVSENLKSVMETNEITGFEFSELDYKVIVEDSNLS